MSTVDREGPDERAGPRTHASDEEGRFNLSAWALRHQALVIFLITLATLFGILAYTRLAQSEDPPFTFRVMVIQTFWPGATARQMQDQITDRIGRKLQETPNIDFLRSYSRPGESLIFFNMKDSAPAKDVPDTWYQVRKKVGDIAATLPAGVQGPFFNDEFGDVYTNIYALEGDGYDDAELKDYADRMREELLRVPDVAKVDYFGEQTQVIHVEISNRKLATLGLNPRDIVGVLQAQNAVTPAGSYETASDHLIIRSSGQYRSVQGLEDTSFRVNGRLLRLGDIARIYSGYQDPPDQQLRYMGHDVLG
ncbi:MAG TPA: efflux RND transporter permease subunit, partial [Trinickia sp.]|nr:efflux RND transporter permease subunit [Trinickia sp.]